MVRKGILSKHHFHKHLIDEVEKGPKLSKKRAPHPYPMREGGFIQKLVKGALFKPGEMLVNAFDTNKWKNTFKKKGEGLYGGNHLYGGMKYAGMRYGGMFPRNKLEATMQAGKGPMALMQSRSRGRGFTKEDRSFNPKGKGIGMAAATIAASILPELMRD